MGNFDHRADDLPVQPAAGIQIPDQRHVELDQVDLEAAKDIQRGIAAAEIVQPELVSLLPQVTQLRLEPVGGGGDIPFGDLHDEAVPGDEFLHVILLIQVLDLLGDVPVIKILGSEVDRDRKQRKVGFRADRDLFHHLLDHIQVQFVQEVIFLQDGDEFARGDISAVRVDPAGQSLKTGGPVGLHPADSLVEDFDPTFLQGPVQVLNDIPLAPVMLVSQLGIHPEDGVQIAADALERVP